MKLENSTWIVFSYPDTTDLAKNPRGVSFWKMVIIFAGHSNFSKKVSYCYFSFPSLIATISNLNNGNSQT